MDNSIERMQASIELALNTISADQEVFGVILQVLLVRLIASSPNRAREFSLLRDQVLGSIDQTLPSVDDPQGAERHKQLTRMRAEAQFEVIAEALGLVSNRTPPSGAS